MKSPGLKFLMVLFLAEGLAVAAPSAGEEPRVVYRRAEGGAVGGLRARVVPPKEPLARPPGQVQRLVVKFSDAFLARAESNGDVSVVASERQEMLGAVIGAHRLVFERLHTVSDESILALRERAERASGVAQPDLLGMLVAKPKVANRETVWRAAQALHGLPQVEFVVIESLDAPPPPPAMDIAPTSELLSSHQDYRTSSGIDVNYAWSQFGAKGAGVVLTDCEYFYTAAHEDLADLVSTQPGVNSYYTNFGADHGTAVLGILSSGENAYGMTGATPQATVRFYPEYSTVNGSFQSRAATVVAAIASSEAGDVVLLEMQTSTPSGSYGPAEYEQEVWTAVQAGTSAGVIVVAAAGNGALNLDDASFSAYQERGDSGAIIVGAGNGSRSRISFSTYGTRVNLQGWGAGVASTGYGDLRKYGGDGNQAYTSGFSGTSSACSMVAAAVTLTQSVARARLSRALTPGEMRQLLIDSGRPQTGDLAQPIGPLPNLAAALPLLMTRFKPAMTSMEIFGRYYLDNAAAAPDGDGDADGVPNLLEYFLGTDPTAAAAADQARLPRVTAVNQGEVAGVSFEFQRNVAAGDVGWLVELTENLAAAAWRPLVAGEEGVEIVEDAEQVRVFIPETMGNGRWFARLRVTKNAE